MIEQKGPRISRTADGLVVDLEQCDGGGVLNGHRLEAVVDGGGWHVRPQRLRTARTVSDVLPVASPLPHDEGDAVSDLFPAIGLTGPALALVVGWLVAALVNRSGTQPILVLTGPNRDRVARAVVDLIDPREPTFSDHPPPSNPGRWLTLSRGRWLAAFAEVNFAGLDHYQRSRLCSAVELLPVRRHYEHSAVRMPVLVTTPHFDPSEIQPTPPIGPRLLAVDTNAASSHWTPDPGRALGGLLYLVSGVLGKAATLESDPYVNRELLGRVMPPHPEFVFTLAVLDVVQPGLDSLPAYFDNFYQGENHGRTQN